MFLNELCEWIVGSTFFSLKCFHVENTKIWAIRSVSTNSLINSLGFTLEESLYVRPRKKNLSIEDIFSQFSNLFEMSVPRFQSATTIRIITDHYFIYNLKLIYLICLIYYSFFPFFLFLPFMRLIYFFTYFIWLCLCLYSLT